MREVKNKVFSNREFFFIEEFAYQINYTLPFLVFRNSVDVKVKEVLL